MRTSVVILVCLFLLNGVAVADENQEKWAGIDEAVIEKYASDKGREAAAPLVNVEGDMLLFLFALAGAIGGFIMGYYWHKVFVTGKPGDEDGGRE